MCEPVCFLLSVKGLFFPAFFLFSLYRKLSLHPLAVPLRPTASKYLQEKWDKAAYDMHRKRVRRKVFDFYNF